MHELFGPDEVAASTDSLLVQWASQALLPSHPYGRGRAYRLGDAVAVVAPRLNRDDRIVVDGPEREVAELLVHTWERHGPDYRPLLRTDLADAPLLAGFADAARADFGWMELSRKGTPVETHRARWLRDDELAEADELIRFSNPDAFALPSGPEKSRWAGWHNTKGQLVSVGGDPWSGPSVGFLGGVATTPHYRGRGASTAVCGFLRDSLLARYGRAALMVDQQNTAAIRVYRRLGFDYRRVTALWAAPTRAAAREKTADHASRG
ncbi:GNAT family N-acetyltransferase [Actinoalloteichus hymeniacidonis]|uniref:GNAT family N-acetyltransferase n=1 Tax=Actinoalloteichus hymeniacidonis TaxID=340345 RepID=UPI000853DA22|nr:GNAT family N-acetyltransferase [Actinoalloteichus hymeniacidonis]MBB5906117.1 ribosomal protein S18 acetylase RimI-like enzyme [Actinoalloteichus hymeniacidonis]